MRKILALLPVLMLVCTLAFAQSRTVTGTVRDASGNPIPFATVTESGTKNAAQADANGNFSISVKQNAGLTITAAGYQATNISSSGDLSTVTLARGEGQLQEVVVTALGQRRTRNQVPYAAQQVNGDEVSKQRSSNFINNLSGKVSGLELRQSNTLGGSTNVVIRGVKSLTGSNSPLFVIDGVPIDNSNYKTSGQNTGRGGYDYGNTSSDINPDDIESITVLKGAASTALYGSRGGNGVILITTKKGRKGLGITVNSGVTMGKYDKSTFAKYQNEYGGGYGTYYEDPTGYFFYRDPSNGFNYTGAPNSALVVPTSEDASYGGRFDPNKLVYQWDAFDTSSAFYGKARPWVAAENGPAYIFQTAWSSNQSVVLDGGSDRGTFKLGYTRNDDWGIMPNSKITKNMVNFGGSFNINDNLVASASVNYTNTTGLGRYGTGYDDKNLMTNFRQWFQTNVDLKELKDAYFRHKQNVTWNWADPTNLSAIYWDNPYFTRYENYENDARNQYFGYVSLNYKVNNWLNVLGRITLDNYSYQIEERQALTSTSVSNYSRNNISFNENNYDLIFNFDKNLSNTVNLKALLGTNVRKNRYQEIDAATNGGLILPGIYSLANSVNPILAPGEADQSTQVWGNFAGATISFRDMLTLDGTIRNDRTSTLPKGNNSYWYPSASLGFVFSKLVPTATWLSYGKLRANYAVVGSGTSAYRLDDYYNINTPFNGTALTSVSTTKNNPNLLPENTNSYELGLEANFLKGRVGFDVSYYNAKTFNQIYAVPVSTATGYNSKILNAGNVRNKGFEASLYFTPVQTKAFSWTSTINWTRNRNKVEELATGIDNIVLGTFQGGVSLNATLGEPYGTIRGKDFIYEATTGQRVISQTTGRYLQSTSSNIVIGNVNPDWVGGINNSFRFKNINFSFLIDARKGGDVFSLDMYYGLATGLYPETAGLNDLGNPSRLPIAQGGGVILPGVDANGKPNTVRAANTNYGLYGYVRQPNKAFVYDASFVKLREAVLTYSLPSGLISKLQPFKGIDLSLIGRNLWIIHKNLPYADPEEIVSAGNLQGYQVGAYPSVRTFTFNIKLRF